MTSLQAQKEQQAAKAAETAPEGDGPPAAADTSVSDEEIKVEKGHWVERAEGLCCRGRRSTAQLCPFFPLCIEVQKTLSDEPAFLNDTGSLRSPLGMRTDCNAFLSMRATH